MDNPERELVAWVLESKIIKKGMPIYWKHKDSTTYVADYSVYDIDGSILLLGKDSYYEDYAKDGSIFILAHPIWVDAYDIDWQERRKQEK